MSTVRFLSHFEARIWHLYSPSGSALVRSVSEEMRQFSIQITDVRKLRTAMMRQAARPSYLNKDVLAPQLQRLQY